MTHDLFNLSLHQSYEGSDGVTVSNGTSLPIANYGKGLLQSLSPHFNLSTLYHGPYIAHNLLSVY